MKILLTTILFRSTVNGVATSVLNLEKELKKQGHEVRILTVSETGRPYREGNVWYLRSVPAGIYPGVRIPVSIRNGYIKELIEWKPDVVHNQCEFFTFSLAGYIARETGAVFVHTFHTLYEQYVKYIPIGRCVAGAVLGKWLCFRLRGADVLIAPTKKVERALRSYGVKNEIAVIPTGICLDSFFHPISRDRLDRLREECGIEDGAKVVLSLGRLGYEKNVGELLQGFRIAGLNEKQAELLIVGDGPARKSLVRQAENLGLKEAVRFYGMAAPSEVPAFYQLADVFVCASTSESQGLTYAEALAAGLPMLCREDPCLDEVVKQGKNGYTYGTKEQFAACLKELLGAELWRKRAGIYSRKAAEQFGTASFGKRIAGLYRRKLKEREGQDYESSSVLQESKDSFQEWNWPGYADAKRFP